MLNVLSNLYSPIGLPSQSALALRKALSEKKHFSVPPCGLVLAAFKKIALAILASLTKRNFDVMRSRSCQRVVLVDHIVVWQESDTPPPSI